MLATLERGEWIAQGEPVVLLGDSGTGKSHLLIGLGMAACQRGLRVRYTTAAQLVNELAEAADERTLSRLVARYGAARPLRPRRDVAATSTSLRAALEWLFGDGWTEREERASPRGRSASLADFLAEARAAAHRRPPPPPRSSPRLTLPSPSMASRPEPTPSPGAVTVAVADKGRGARPCSARRL